MKLNEKHKVKLAQLGEMCKNLRKMKGYTQKDVADELKVPLFEVQAFENGRTNNAILLAWYFDIEFDYVKCEEVGYEEKRPLNKSSL